MPTVTITAGNISFTGTFPAGNLNRDQFAAALATGLQAVFTANLGIIIGGPTPTTNQGPYIPSGGTEVQFWDPTYSTYYPGGMPSGTIIPYAGNSAPPTFLLCDGSPVSQTTYPRLYATIGQRYANLYWKGDFTDSGTLTSAGQFRLPDLRGRTVLGAGTGTANTAGGTPPSPRVIGEKMGQESVTIKMDQLPNPLNGLEFYEYLSTATQSTTKAYGGFQYDGGKERDVNVAIDTDDTADTINLPPYQCVNFLIRT